MLNIILVLIMIFGSSVNSKAIIWDLNDVLLRSSRFKIARNVGLWNFFVYMIYDCKNPNVEPIVFDVLSCFDDEYESEERLFMPDGQIVPKIMSAWLKGDVSGEEIICKAKFKERELYKNNFFSSSIQKRLVHRTIKAMFNEDVFANSIKINEPGLKLLKECLKNNEVYIISNWDQASFEKIYKQNSRLFSLFKRENICISAECKLLKPQPEIYKYLIEKSGLDPKECIFIDDQKENVEAANKVGINGVWLENGNYSRLRNDLIGLGVI